jgi:16S rRNA (uracil1498-N3)-methyltransferase
MPAGRIFCEADIATGGSLALTKGSSHYVSRVLRLYVGDSVVVFNGSGGEYIADIENIKKDCVTLQVKQYVAVDNESPLNIHLGLSFIRNERMDFAIQKVVELGVASITPLVTERTNVKINTARLDKKIGHWRAIALHACEQSGRCIIPVINNPCKVFDWVSDNDAGLVADPTSQDALPSSISQTAVNILIGPEGGFSAMEIESFHSLRWRSFGMGSRILRAETAAITALSLAQYCWGDLH